MMLSKAGNFILSVDRIKAFSDGVASIVITLLVWEIKSPDISSNATNAELWHALTLLGPNFIAYLISFALIGRYWFFHVVLFRKIKVVDGRLIMMNTLYLLALSFLPFPAMLLGEFDNSLALGIFNTFVIAPGLMLAIMGEYIMAPFKSPKASDRAAHLGLRHNAFILIPFVAILSTVVSYYVLWPGMLVWILLPILNLIRNALIKKST
jgi:uncharacterized membrane protein